MSLPPTASRPSVLPLLSRRAIAAWKPWYVGPPELLLRCLGPLPARLVTEAHVRWPFTRGHQRLFRTLPKHPSLQSVPFRSSAGVDLVLDMTDPSFLYLAGRLPTEPLEVAITSRLVRPGDVFVDVGAHRGLYIAHLLGRLRPSGRMIAFEPSPSNVAFVRRVFGAQPDLELIESAVGDVEGRGVLVADGELGARLSSGATTAGLEVRLCRLDETVRAPSPPHALIVKIDVEGDEAAVLRGARGLLQPGAPSAWLIESLPGEGARRAELLATLRELLPDATVYAVRNNVGLAPIATLRDDDPETLNLLAITASMADRLGDLREIIG